MNISLSLETIRQKLSSRQRIILSPAEHKQACVMFTIVHKENTLHLLLTKRTDTVEYHKGQISFPGGMVDDGDHSPEHAALRELEEEVGIPSSSVTILGTLDDIHIPTGFVVTPFVGYIETLPELHTNKDEVAELLFIPLEKFFDPSLRRTEMRELQGVTRQIFFYDVWKEPVWGATAHIIKQFTDLFL